MKPGMRNRDWLSRLTSAINATDETHRSLSLRAGLGPNYVNQLVNGQKPTPSAEAIIRLCEALNLSLAYVFAGLELTRETEEVARLYASLGDRQRGALLTLLRGQHSVALLGSPAKDDEAQS